MKFLLPPLLVLLILGCKPSSKDGDRLYYLNGDLVNPATPSDVWSGKDFWGARGVRQKGTGLFEFGLYALSNAHRDSGTSGLTNAGEREDGELPNGYREVPDVNKDDEGVNRAANGCVTSCSPAVGATRPTVACGQTLGATLSDKIAECAAANGASASWNGEALGNSGEGTWTLVVYTGTYEVWRDERTKPLWSDDMGKNNWCRATGNAQVTGSSLPDVSGVCTSSSHQDQTNPQSYCAETAGLSSVPSLSENWAAGSYHGAKGYLGKNEGSVYWRIPTLNDWLQAKVNGVGFVLPHLFENPADVNNTSKYYWSAMIVSTSRNQTILFNPSFGTQAVEQRNRSVDLREDYIRCVGRVVE